EGTDRQCHRSVIRIPMSASSDRSSGSDMPMTLPGSPSTPSTNGAERPSRVNPPATANGSPLATYASSSSSVACPNRTTVAATAASWRTRRRAGDAEASTNRGTVLHTRVVRAPYLSARLQGLGTTIFAEMSALAERTGAVNLGQGFPDTDGPPEILEAAVEAIRGGRNQYPPGAGILPLREAIAAHQRRFWDLSFDPETEVLVTAGATEAVAASILALCDTG